MLAVERKTLCKYIGKFNMPGKTEECNNPANEPKYKKDGTLKKTHSNKKQKVKSEVYPFRTLEDIKNIMNYFIVNKQWNYYLLFMLGLNMTRRISDTLKLQWKHFYFLNGRMRNDILEIEEDKTGKIASPHINNAVRHALKLYIEKTGIDYKANAYEDYIFVQHSGNYKGRVVTDEAYRKALKKAAKACGITYNIGTHSTRKTYGMWNRMLHPNDPNSMMILQRTFNHSNETTTQSYIGLTKEMTDKYYDDFGDFIVNSVIGDKPIQFGENSPVISLESNDLRDIITLAYQEGINNSGNADANIHIESINSLMEIIEESLIK